MFFVYFYTYRLVLGVRSSLVNENESDHGSHHILHYDHDGPLSFSANSFEGYENDRGHVNGSGHRDHVNAQQLY